MGYRPVMLLILLVAAVLRLYGLNNLSPPGLAHDEVAHWLINRDIIAGHHAVYFTEAYGHEAGFHYLQTGFMILLGDNALALRLPAAFCGLLLVAVTFALTRRLFGVRVALITAAYLAVLFWPVFYSRQALRAISLPLVSGLSAYFWWRGWGALSDDYFSRPAAGHFALAGLFAGLSLHTYMAARAVPIFYGLFLLYLALFHWPALKKRWVGALLFFLIAAAVSAPLLHYLATNPGAEVRIGEVDAPLRALRAGEIRPVLENTWLIIGMFGVTGDPLWRQNVAGQPVFEWATALFFYSGVLLALWRWRDSRYAFVMLWLLTSMIPSIVTKDAPSSIRISNILPVLAIFPSLVMHSLDHLSTGFQQLSTENGRKWGVSIATFLILLHIGWTAHATFWVWPANEEVQYVWQEGLTKASAYLDNLGGTGPNVRDVAVAGWSPDTMDPPTMMLTLRRQDLQLRYFEPSRTLLVPFNGRGQTSLIIRPTILPLNSFLEEYLIAWHAPPQPGGSFTTYQLDTPPLLQPQFPAHVIFDSQLTYLGYDLLTPPLATPSLPLVTYWRVERTVDEPRRFFLHLLDDQGETVAQDDGLESPPAYWRPGDIILQQHSLDTAVEGPYNLRLGVYNPVTGVRLSNESGLDYILLDRGQ